MVKHLKVESWCQNMVLAVARARDPHILYLFHSLIFVTGLLLIYFEVFYSFKYLDLINCFLEGKLS